MDELDLFSDVKEWDKKTGNHAYVPEPEEKREDGDPVIYCHSCGTDISKLNHRNFHLMHDVKLYKHDPRDKRYPIEEVVI